jgi:DNA mismatch repair protein MutS2
MIASDKVLAKLDYGAIRERLAGYCLLPMAKELAESLVPQADLHTVRLRLRETDEGKILLRTNPLFSVRGAREIRPYLERCKRGGILNPAEFLEIRDTLKTARQIRNTIVDSNQAGKADYSELFVIREIAAAIVPQKNIEDEISRSVAEDGSINDRASAELSRLRKIIHSSQQKIKDSLDSILRNANYQKMLQDNVVTTGEIATLFLLNWNIVRHFRGLFMISRPAGQLYLSSPWPWFSWAMS